MFYKGIEIKVYGHDVYNFDLFGTRRSHQCGKHDSFMRQVPIRMDPEYR
ncbi:hypothetical protein CGRA01v4_11113 [Colletotrichum graminicola]|nr:hypothetical protein CGRA01v4_11113 [Colletotrichum graminicola]